MMSSLPVVLLATTVFTVGGLRGPAKHPHGHANVLGHRCLPGWYENDLGFLRWQDGGEAYGEQDSAWPGPELELEFTHQCHPQDEGEISPFRLSSLDHPSVWTPIPLGTYKIHVLPPEGWPLDYVELRVNGAPTPLTSDEGFVHSMACPEPARHLVQARYLSGNRWSAWSAPLRFEVRLPEPPRIIAVAEQDHVVVPHNDLGRTEIRSANVRLRLGGIIPGESVVVYANGRPISRTTVTSDCCVDIPLRGQVAPGTHRLVVRRLACADACPMTSQASNEVFVHYYETGAYLLGPGKHDCPTGVKPTPAKTGCCQNEPPRSQHDDSREAKVTNRSVHGSENLFEIAYLSEGGTAEGGTAEGGTAEGGTAEGGTAEGAAADGRLEPDPTKPAAAGDTETGDTAKKPADNDKPKDENQDQCPSEDGTLTGDQESEPSASERLTKLVEKYPDTFERLVNALTWWVRLGDPTARPDVEEGHIEWSLNDRVAQLEKWVDEAMQQNELWERRRSAVEALHQLTMPPESEEGEMTHLSPLQRQVLEMEARVREAEREQALRERLEKARKRLQELRNVAPQKAPPASDDQEHQAASFPKSFHFASAAHFPMRDFGLQGELLERDGLVIYEGMQLTVASNGDYRVRFRSSHPQVPVTLRLQLKIQTAPNQPWYTITLSPIHIDPSSGGTSFTTRCAEATWGCDGEGCCEPARLCVCSGNSELLRRCFEQLDGENVTIHRTGTARFGYGYASHR